MATKKFAASVCSKSSLILADKTIDAINGWSESVLRQGAKVLVLPCGEKDHKWSSRISGMAFQAFNLETKDQGWVSPNSLGDQIFYTTHPEKFGWTLSEKEATSWWICKVSDETEYDHAGLAQAGLREAVDIAAKALKGAIVIEVNDRVKGWVAQPRPASAAAAAKLGRSWQPNMADQPSPEDSGFVPKSFWTGTARWATQEDLTKIFEGKALEIALTFLMK